MSVRDWFLAPAPAPAPVGEAAPRARLLVRARRPSPRAVLTSAAVLGRPGEVEPVAAAVALALRARAATVVVVAPAPADPSAVPGEAASASGGTPAARRLAAKLAAHGLDATGRSRLAWVRVPADAPAAARRACVVGAPAVLAVAAPLGAAISDIVAEQELVIVVTDDHDGPLAQLALAALEPLAPAVVTTPPLSRGLLRWAARAGIAPPRGVRDLLRGT